MPENQVEDRQVSFENNLLIEKGYLVKNWIPFFFTIPKHALE